MKDMGEPCALPLDDLLQVLQAAGGKTYQVRATLPASLLPFPTRRGESFVAEVVVHASQIRSCVIRDSPGAIRLEGSRAFALVRSREQLVWLIQQIQPPEPPSLPSFPAESAPPDARSFSSPLALPWAARPAPVRLQKSPEALEQMTRRQRQVWLLIDGRRTIHDIAHLLGAPLNELDQELTTLEMQGLITPGRT